MKQLPKLHPNTVLVAILNNMADFKILQTQKWYRIPVSTAPKNISDGTAEYIAFYQTAKFGNSKWRIQWYAPIKDIKIVSRQVLFPEESANSPKAFIKYYQILFDELIKLPTPIISTRGHRLLFLQTSYFKFFNALNLNTLFNDSPLEELFSDLLNGVNLPFERQWEVYTPQGNHYYFDFAIFCGKQNIGIECDGDAYHDKREQVHYDKNRDNELQSAGWDVLRYTTHKILNDFDSSLSILYKTINQQGGYQNPLKPNEYIFAGNPNTPTLF